MLLNAFYRYLASRISPAGPGARLSILIYHRVLPQVDTLFPNEPTAASFDKQMRMLKNVFNVLPLAEAVQGLRQGMLPERAACITFDDGYADNLTIAAPILKKHGLHATFFIATHYLNGGRMFNDTVIEAIRRSPLKTLDLSSPGYGVYNIATPQAKAGAIGDLLPQVKYLPLDEREHTVVRIAELAQCGPLPSDLMMTTEQLKALHGMGMEIGGHTDRHPIIAKLDAQGVRAEIGAGKEFLEKILNSRLRLFAYPNGKPGVDYLPEQAAIVKELGFEAAVSTQWGSASLSSDMHQLPRFTPWSAQPMRYIPMLLANLKR